MLYFGFDGNGESEIKTQFGGNSSDCNTNISFPTKCSFCEYLFLLCALSPVAWKSNFMKLKKENSNGLSNIAKICHGIPNH